MKLCTFEVKTPVGPFQRLGAVRDQKGSADILDLNFAYAAKLAADGEARSQTLADARVPSEMIAFGAAGAATLEAAREAVSFAASSPGATGPQGEQLLYPVAEVKLLSPVQNPPLIRGFVCFEKHLKNAYAISGLEVPPIFYERPLAFKSSAAHMAGPGDEVPFPSYSDKLDFELELGVVIGRGGRDIPEERAGEHILGYSILNDWSDRDAQIPEMRMGTGPFKGKDWCWSMGPWIATPDELENMADIPMYARVNGEVWIETRPGQMLWTFEQIIAYASMDELLQPGDILGTGTVPGGCGLEIGRFLKPGDRVELDMGPLGVLRNRLGQKTRSRSLAYR